MYARTFNINYWYFRICYRFRPPILFYILFILPIFCDFTPNRSVARKFAKYGAVKHPPFPLLFLVFYPFSRSPAFVFSFPMLPQVDYLPPIRLSP